MLCVCVCVYLLTISFLLLSLTAGEETLVSNQTENSPSMDPVLYKAAVKGDINPFKERAEPPDLLLQITRNQNTVLHVYIIAPSESEKSIEFVDGILSMCWPLLLQVNVKKETPLHLAVRHGHVAVVNYLIQAVKDRQMLRMTNTQMDTAIHEAIRSNHLDVVQSLIKEDPHFSYSANHAGDTPLNKAKTGGFHESLLENKYGVSPAYGDPIGLSHLHIAVICKDESKPVDLFALFLYRVAI